MAAKEIIEEFKCTENPFRDFGVRNPDQALAKSMFAMYIQDAIGAKDITQREAGKLIGIDQAKVSAIVNGNLKGFAVERLMRFLNALDIDIEIKLRPKSKTHEHGQTRVTST